MESRNYKSLILVVEDDEDDWVLVRDAFEEAACSCKLRPSLLWLKDGVELLDYLRGNGAASTQDRPDLILLDLNMPRMGGREALKQIKSDPYLQGIPTVIYTTSQDRFSTMESYRNGANSVLIKPDSFELVVKAMEAICHYWFTTARLPHKGANGTSRNN